MRMRTVLNWTRPLSPDEIPTDDDLDYLPSI